MMRGFSRPRRLVVRVSSREDGPSRCCEAFGILPDFFYSLSLRSCLPCFFVSRLGFLQIGRRPSNLHRIPKLPIFPSSKPSSNSIPFLSKKSPHRSDHRTAHVLVLVVKEKKKPVSVLRPCSVVRPKTSSVHSQSSEPYVGFLRHNTFRIFNPHVQINFMARPRACLGHNSFNALPPSSGFALAQLIPATLIEVLLCLWGATGYFGTVRLWVVLVAVVLQWETPVKERNEEFT